MELNFSPDRRSVVPLYAQLSQAIKDAIISGELTQGEKLLSENEMVSLYGLSRMTVRTALSALCSENYIEKIHGKGAFVSYRPADSQGNIDVILEISYTLFSTHYIQSISDVLTKHNYRFIFHDSHDDEESIYQTLTKIMAAGTTGIILQPPHSCAEATPKMRELFFNLSQRGIPYLLLDHDFPGIPGPKVIFDDFTGGKVAAEHLVTLGHRRCAIVYHMNYLEEVLRRDGFNTCFTQRGGCPLFEIEYLPDMEEKLVASIQNEKITAVFCPSDEIALQVVRILASHDIPVPQMVSVVGYDDTVIAVASNPQLTSIVHPKGILGRLAAEKMVSLIEKAPPPKIGLQLEPRICARASSGPAANAEMADDIACSSQHS